MKIVVGRLYLEMQQEGGQRPPYMLRASPSRPQILAEALVAIGSVGRSGESLQHRRLIEL